MIYCLLEVQVKRTIFLNICGVKYVGFQWRLLKLKQSENRSQRSIVSSPSFIYFPGIESE